MEKGHYQNIKTETLYGKLVNQGIKFFIILSFFPRSYKFFTRHTQLLGLRQQAIIGTQRQCWPTYSRGRDPMIPVPEGVHQSGNNNANGHPVTSNAAESSALQIITLSRLNQKTVLAIASLYRHRCIDLLNSVDYSVCYYHSTSTWILSIVPCTSDGGFERIVYRTHRCARRDLQIYFFGEN